MNKLTSLLITVSLTLTLSAGVNAQGDVKDHPGYVDFSSLAGFGGAEPTVQISLKTPLLNMVTNLLRQDDAEAAEFVSKLLRVSVSVFESESEALDLGEVSNSMVLLASELDAQNWERVVRVRENENHVDIYFRISPDADFIYGIAVMVAEESEIVLVNIVGDISVDDLGALARRFDIDELSDIDINVDTDL